VEHGGVNPDTVAWAADNARELLRDESERVRALDTKAGQLAGFAGVILALLGSIAPEAFRSSLGDVGVPLFAAFYLLAAALLASSILWIVFLTLKPQRFIAIAAAELGEYLEDERLLRSDPWALQIRTMRAVRDAAVWAQVAGERKADRLTVGMILFAAGLTATLGAVVTLGIRSF